jgi:hypothetical protein
MSNGSRVVVEELKLGLRAWFELRAVALFAL